MVQWLSRVVWRSHQWKKCQISSASTILSSEKGHKNVTFQWRAVDTNTGKCAAARERLSSAHTQTGHAGVRAYLRMKPPLMAICSRSSTTRAPGWLFTTPSWFPPQAWPPPLILAHTHSSQRCSSTAPPFPLSACVYVCVCVYMNIYIFNMCFNFFLNQCQCAK